MKTVKDRNDPNIANPYNFDLIEFFLNGHIPKIVLDNKKRFITYLLRTGLVVSTTTFDEKVISKAIPGLNITDIESEKGDYSIYSNIVNIL